MRDPKRKYQDRLYREKNKETLKITERVRQQKYRDRNKEKIRIRNAKYRDKEYQTIYKRNNRPKLNALNQKRRSLKIEACTSTTDYHKIEWLYNQAEKMSKMLGVRYHIDHVIPLSKGGKHHQNNLIIMRSDYNLRKGDSIVPLLIDMFCPDNILEL